MKKIKLSINTPKEEIESYKKEIIEKAKNLDPSLITKKNLQADPNILTTIDHISRLFGSLSNLKRKIGIKAFYRENFSKRDVSNDNNIMNLLKQGLYDKQIANQLNISEGVVSRFRRKNNIKSNYKIDLEKSKSGFVVKNNQEIVITKDILTTFIQNGLSINDVAKQLNVSASVVVSRAKKWNLSFKKNKKFNCEIYTKLRSKGLKEVEIQKIMNISSAQLALSKKNNGYEKRSNFNRNNLEQYAIYIESLLKEGFSSSRIADIIDNPNITSYYIEKYFPEYLMYKKLHCKSSEFSNAFFAFRQIPKNYCLNNIQKQMIVGSLMGDGYCDKNGYLRFEHSVSQLDYLKAKHSLLNPISSTTFYRDHYPQPSVYFNTVVHKEFKDLYKIFYGGKEKNIFNPKIWEYVTPLSLVFWYLDDGKRMAFTFGNKNKGYNYDNIQKFINYIKEKFNIILEYKKEKYSSSLVIKSCSDIFKSLLNRYCTSDLKYKLYDFYVKEDFAKGYSFLNQDWENRKKNCLNILRKECKSFITTYWEFPNLDSDSQKKIIQDNLNGLRKRGFPYPILAESRLYALFCSFKKNGYAKQENNNLRSGISGIQLCNSMFPNLYKGKRKIGRSPMDVFENDESMKKIIFNLLSTSKLGFSDNTLLRYIKNLANPVYNFKPSIARYLFSKYGKNGAVYDYAAGYGGRMLGAFCSGVKKYIAVEANKETFNNLIRFSELLQKWDSIDIKLQIFNNKSEDFIPDAQIDFAFSSPPYFDLEEYSPDGNYSLSRFDGFYTWIENYFIKTISNIFGVLKPMGYLGINITPFLKKDVIYILTTKFNLKLIKEYNLYFATKFNDKYKEPILIFQKI